MVILWRKWIVFVRRNLFSATFAAVYPRVWAVLAWAIQGVKLLVITLFEILSVLVKSHVSISLLSGTAERVLELIFLLAKATVWPAA
jgi:hypothetical protein